MSIPTGPVTFLFTDNEGSARLSQDFDKSMQGTLLIHRKIFHEVIEENNGFIFKTVGEAICCAFGNVYDAVKTAVEIQRKLSSVNADEPGLKVRMGMHTGMAEWSGTDYMGYITLARVQRIMSASYGGQILISQDTYEYVKEKIDALTETEFSFRDLGDRRLKDLTQPIKLYQVCAVGITLDFPALKTLDARPNNLPVQLTNFIGRENEISEIKKLFSGSRLITLIGTGKTRLAMQVAADLIDEFDDGVWLVELAPLLDPALILQKINASLGISDQPDRETEFNLISNLKNKTILIILDNCEHLIEACARIAEKLLQSCSKLKIIATSRETLRCKGEVVHKVLSLAHPEPEQANTPFELSQFEAVRLFIERALAVNPDFRVNNENAPALAQICYQLDGIPLAIELAAVRIKVLPVEKICAKLDDRFKLLTGGKRTALPRQQTLRALIDWSYDLLTAKEKLLLQRLSVFSGGWSMEAAEEVCSDENIEIFETMDTQTNLLDKSLINSSEKSGSIRFFMLESIRQYANEKLEEKKEMSMKHFYYFKKIADVNQMRLSKTDQLEWIKLIESEQDNIRNAIQWGSQNEPDDAYDFVYDMTEFWSIKGYFREGLQTCLKVLNANLPVKDILRAKIYQNIALMKHSLGNISEAKEYIEKSLFICREINDEAGIARSLNVLGVITSLNQENQAQALEYYEQALSIFRKIGDRKEMGIIMYNMSFLAGRKGNNDEALNYKTEALNIFKEFNDTHQITMILASLGVFEFRRKNFEEALNYSSESLKNSNLLGDKYLISINLINLGSTYSSLKEYGKAADLLKESIVILKEGGYMGSMIVALMYLGEVTSNLGEEKKAISLHKESIQVMLDSGIDYYLGFNLYRLGISSFNLEKFEDALKYFLYMKEITEKYFIPFGAEKFRITDEHIEKIKKIIGNETYEKLLNDTGKLNKEEAINFALGSDKE